MPKQQTEMIPSDPKSPLGDTPAKLAKRELMKPNEWCPKTDIEFDTWCDPDNPKTVIFKDVSKAASTISPEFPKTPLTRSKCCVQFGTELYYKYEIFHRTGSFLERGAFYSLSMLSEEQRRGGVYTASLGNWALALSYQGQRLNIPITVVLPISVGTEIVEKCQCDFGARIILHGKNLAEAKKQAFIMIAENRSGTYINSYDHPSVIAASGSIGIEILEQLPNTDAIILPIGGGGLIAGVATAVKQLNPRVLIYGVEPVKCCSFFKAMENERPYQTEVAQSLAGSLAVPTAGHNAFHTARSLIDKMVTLAANDTRGRLRVLSVIANVGCNILQSYTDRAWIDEDDLETVYVTLIIETRDLGHSCTLKRVMARIFPGICEFLEEPFSPIPICACFPKRLP